MNLTREEARGRAAHLTVRSYDVSLDLTGSTPTFASTTLVRFGSSRPGGSTFIDLVAPQVRRVVLNGGELDVAAVADGTRIQLPGLAAENELLVEADCAYMHTGEGLHRFVDPVDDGVYVYTQFEAADARRVFAVFDQPDLKATFSFSVTAPAGWRVVSNSPAPEPMVTGGDASSGARTWRFPPTPRLAPYVTAIAGGPFHVVAGELTSIDGRTIPLGVFCRASLAPYLDADEIIDLTCRGFAYFEPIFGMAYPFQKYDQLFVPEFNAGAMENAATVTITETWLFRSRVAESTVEYRANAILHELAHMWFGDLVTMRWWDDLWLNESFATYAATNACAEATRWQSAWMTFASQDKTWAYRQDELPTTHPVVADIADLEAAEQNFDGITYAKGASVIRQLAAWVGREQFEEGLRRYFVRHAWGNAELSDLLAELEATSGRDVRRWSQLWLESAGVTTLRSELTADAGGVVTSFGIRQEAPSDHPVLRPHRVAIGRYDLVEGVLTRTGRVEVDVDGERTEVPELVGRRRPDLLLLNDDDLAYAKIRLDPGSLETAFGHLGAFADPFPRALVWSMAWDMVRDAELSAREYVELVLGNIAQEVDSSTISELLGTLASSVRRYVAPEHRDEIGRTVAGRLVELARASAPGSDLQLQVVKAFTSHAAEDGHLETVAGILEGRERLEGLAIDTDLRWELLTALVAGGRAADAEIDQELGRDPTAAGERAAAAACAARPTPAAKQAAWASVVESDDLSNALQSSVISGFGRVQDRSLLEPYVEPYFASLDRIWSTRTDHTAMRIVSGLYPTLLASPALVERTDAFLASLDGDKAGLRRLTLENRDAVVRAIRAQERDRRR